MFYADGNIEIIEDVEALEDGFKACRLLGGCCFVKAVLIANINRAVSPPEAILTSGAIPSPTLVCT